MYVILHFGKILTTSCDSYKWIFEYVNIQGATCITWDGTSNPQHIMKVQLSEPHSWTDQSDNDILIYDNTKPINLLHCNMRFGLSWIAYIYFFKLCWVHCDFFIPITWSLPITRNDLRISALLRGPIKIHD